MQQPCAGRRRRSGQLATGKLTRLACLRTSPTSCASRTTPVPKKNGARRSRSRARTSITSSRIGASRTTGPSKSTSYSANSSSPSWAAMWAAGSGGPCQEGVALVRSVGSRSDGLMSSAGCSDDLLPPHHAAPCPGATPTTALISLHGRICREAARNDDSLTCPVELSAGATSRCFRV